MLRRYQRYCYSCTVLDCHPQPAWVRARLKAGLGTQSLVFCQEPTLATFTEMTFLNFGLWNLEMFLYLWLYAWNESLGVILQMTLVATNDFAFLPLVPSTIPCPNCGTGPFYSTIKTWQWGCRTFNWEEPNGIHAAHTLTGAIFDPVQTWTLPAIWFDPSDGNSKENPSDVFVFGWRIPDSWTLPNKKVTGCADCCARLVRDAYSVHESTTPFQASKASARSA